MRLPFRIHIERLMEVRLYVQFGFQSGRLADLVQFLAHSQVTIVDLVADRSLYHLGMPERSVEVTFLVANLRHKNVVLQELFAKGFAAREIGRTQ